MDLRACSHAFWSYSGRQLAATTCRLLASCCSVSSPFSTWAYLSIVACAIVPELDRLAPLARASGSADTMRVEATAPSRVSSRMHTTEVDGAVIHDGGWGVERGTGAGGGWIGCDVRDGL